MVFVDEVFDELDKVRSGQGRHFFLPLPSLRQAVFFGANTLPRFRLHSQAYT